MTKAIFNFGEYGLDNFEISGHSGYANYGSDIVCSGISTAVFTTLNLLDKMYPEYINLIQDEKKGYIKCEFSFDYQAGTKTQFLAMIIQNLIDVLSNIERDYPKNLKVIINDELLK
jgi:uncharacterized protein YsxB (DUF464 family)